MSPSARPTVRRAVGAFVAGLVLVACGGGESASTDTAAASEGPAAPAPPQVSKEEFDDLETRVLELEVKVANLEAEMRTASSGEGSESDGSTGESTGEGDATGDTEAPAEPGAWSYENTDQWGSLSPDYAACSEGTEQSPIDLGSAQGEDIPNTLFNYSPVPATIEINDHTVELQAPGAGKIVLDDQLYDFAQLHFHAPSEHTIEGERYPLEIHLVHRTADGKVAVIAILVTEGEPWPAFDDIIVSIPLEQHKSADVVGQVDLTKLLPDLTAAYRYDGSLTTPPCTEGVQWVVLQGTIHMSKEQIDHIVSSLPEPNSRPQQPLNDREVVIDLSAG